MVSICFWQACVTASVNRLDENWQTRFSVYLKCVKLCKCQHFRVYRWCPFASGKCVASLYLLHLHPWLLAWFMSTISKQFCIEFTAWNSVNVHTLASIDGVRSLLASVWRFEVFACSQPLCECLRTVTQFSADFKEQNYLDCSYFTLLSCNTFTLL